MRKVQTIDGLPVYDADRPIIIEVTKEDINRRRRKDPGRCAISEACKRELHTTKALTYLSRLYVFMGDHWLRYKLPESARQELSAFDRGGGFSVGTYRIVPMQPSSRAGAEHQGGPGTQRKLPGLPKKKPQVITHRQVEGVRARSPLMGGALERL